MSGGLAIPRFEPEVYFAQRLEAYGVFVDRFGAIRRQFNVEAVSYTHLTLPTRS